MNEQKIKELFAAHKTEVPDDGFTRQTIGRLPDRRGLVWQWLMGICMVAGIVFTYLALSSPPVVEQIELLVRAITMHQMPPLTSVVVYVGVLAFLGTLGYSVVQAASD